jgi:hypothetical protein
MNIGSIVCAELALKPYFTPGATQDAKASAGKATAA